MRTEARTPSPTLGAAAPPRGRLAAIDAARAAALLAMAVYHALWDLGDLRLTAENYALTGPGRLAAASIAGSFLVLVGIGLVLMNGRGVRWRPTLWRLARIGGAALLVTLGTWAVFPDAYVFFGVLHCIALASVIGLPFVFVPVPATAVAAALVLAAPRFVHAGFIHAAFLDGPALYFIGLGANTPRTNDYVPLFPWFGMVLAGIVLGRLGLPLLARSRLGAWVPHSWFGRGAAFAGRHSLAFYLVHQLVLFGVLAALAWAIGPNPRAGLRTFRTEYAGICARTGGDPDLCRIAGRCTSDALVREGLYSLDDRPFTPAERVRAQALSQGCYGALEAARRRAPAAGVP